MKIHFLKGAPGYILTHRGENQLIQTDWERPGVAQSFGWNIQDVQVINAHYYGVPCRHESTDGTVQCAGCGLLPGTFIEAATNFLNECVEDGKVVEDPGYFLEVK